MAKMIQGYVLKKIGDMAIGESGFARCEALVVDGDDGVWLVEGEDFGDHTHFGDRPLIFVKRGVDGYRVRLPVTETRMPGFTWHSGHISAEEERLPVVEITAPGLYELLGYIGDTL